jgi:hypothetical protein
MAGEEMNIQRISKHVGHDGKNYFCWHCGLATFDSPLQVNGHQSICPKRQVPVANTPTIDTTNTTTLGGGGRGSGGLPAIPEIKTKDTEIAIVRKEMSEMRADMKSQYAKVFNELPHTNAVKSFAFLGITKEGWAIIVIVALMAYSLGRSNCRCDSSDSNNKRPRNNGGSFGSNMAGKIAGKFIDKLF